MKEKEEETKSEGKNKEMKEAKKEIDKERKNKKVW